MDTEATGGRPGSGQVYEERIYPQVDCVGVYLWIWELTAHTKEGTRVVARRLHRERPSAGGR